MKERNQEIHVLFLPEEMEMLREKMAEIGVVNRSAYVRKMALDGYCINLDLTDMKEMICCLPEGRLQQNVSGGTQGRNHSSQGG